MVDSNIISYILLIPIFTILCISFAKRNQTITFLSASASLLTTLLSFGLFFSFDSNYSGLQFVHFIPAVISNSYFQVDC